MSYQKVILVGRLGRDPEMRYTPNGTPVTNLSVATDRRWTNDDGSQVKETTWFRVTAWGRLAETCNQYLQKGRQVLVEGRVRGERVPQSDGSFNIQPRVWTGNDGVARASFEVTAQTVRFLGRAGETSLAAEPGVPEEPPVEEEEGIPF